MDICLIFLLAFFLFSDFLWIVFQKIFCFLEKSTAQSVKKNTADCSFGSFFISFSYFRILYRIPQPIVMNNEVFLLLLSPMLKKSIPIQNFSLIIKHFETLTRSRDFLYSFVVDYFILNIKLCECRFRISCKKKKLILMKSNIERVGRKIYNNCIR